MRISLVRIDIQTTGRSAPAAGACAAIVYAAVLALCAVEARPAVGGASPLPAVPWRSAAPGACAIVTRAIDAGAPGAPSTEGESFALLPGWPFNVGYWPRKPAVVDLEGDGPSEVLIGTGNGSLHVLRADGTYLSPAWPRSLGISVTAPAAADFDGDGVQEILIAEVTGFSGGYFPNGRVHVFRPDGSYFPGWPVILEGGVIDECSVSAGDIDDDGRPEIIVGTGSSYQPLRDIIYFRNVYAFRADGTVLPGWPVQTGDGGAHRALAPRCAPVLADLDGDRDLEIVVGCLDAIDPNGGHNAIEVFHHDGTRVAGFPVYNAVWNYSIAAADIDQDGEVEIVTHGELYDRFGDPEPGWAVQSYVISEPGLADIGRDGFVEYAYGTGGGSLNIVDSSGDPLPGWPVHIENQGIIDGNPVLADIDGAGELEILIGAYTSNRLYALHHDGTAVSGFPVTTGGGNRGLVVCDLDGDGLVDILDAADNGLVYVFSRTAPHSPAGAPWPTYQGDNQRTGFYRSPWAASVEHVDPSGRGAVLQAWPNPLGRDGLLRLRISGGGRVGPVGSIGLTIHDATGRLLRHLAAPPSPAGERSVVWDGRTDEGLEVGPGVYFCRARAAGATLTRSLIVAR